MYKCDVFLGMDGGTVAKPKSNRSFNQSRQSRNGKDLFKAFCFLILAVLLVCLLYSYNTQNTGAYEDDWTVHDMRKDLGCESIFQKERPIHSQATWDHAIALYKRIVGSKSSIDNSKSNGFNFPIEVRQVPGKGRGIFASEKIPAGELVWSTKRTARFRDGPSYRKFIYGVEVGFACDVLQWADVQDVGHRELRVSVDLDEGCFCNDGGGSSEANLGCDEEAAKDYKGGCKDNYFSLSDIEAGEELLCSYGDFAIRRGWRKFGL